MQSALATRSQSKAMYGSHDRDSGVFDRLERLLAESHLPVYGSQVAGFQVFHQTAEVVSCREVLPLIPNHQCYSVPCCPRQCHPQGMARLRNKGVHLGMEFQAENAVA